MCVWHCTRGVDKSLARPGSKQARKNFRDARDFNNIETRAVIIFFSCKAPKEIHAILTETLACFLLGRAKGLSTPLTNLSNSGVSSVFLEKGCNSLLGEGPRDESLKFTKLD